MRYLETVKIVHRDVSARNLLVDEKYTVKVSDFGEIFQVETKGMSRITENDYYKANAESKIPIRWTAPEIFSGGSYSSKTDVWSFGVTLWEVNIYKINKDLLVWY